MTILEFHEETQGFHFNQVINNVPQNALNTFGWEKVGICTSNLEAGYFCDFIQIEYIDKGVKLTAKNAIDTFNNLCRFIISINNK
jgi:hypothetical protein